MSDLGAVGRIAAELMDIVEEDGAQVGDALVIVEAVVTPDGSTTIFHRCTSDRAVIGAGLAAFAYRSLTDGARSDDE